MEEVESRVNEITVPQIGIGINLTRITWGSYWNQLGVMLATNEEFDLFNTSQHDRVTPAVKGQTIPLDDLLTNYGQDILATLDKDLLNTGRIGGQVYNIPCNFTINNIITFFGKKAWADEAGINTDQIKTWDDLEQACLKIKKLHPDAYPLATDTGRTWGLFPIDLLGSAGDGAPIYGCLENVFSDSTTVVNWYATDAYKKYCEMFYRWAKEGLIVPDAASTSESGNQLIKSGKAWGKSQIGPEKQYITEWMSRVLGQEACVIQLSDSFQTELQMTYWCVPSSSKKAAESIKWLNYFFTSPEMNKYFIYGIEGKHFEFVDKAKGTVKFVDGTDEYSDGWRVYDWGYPDRSLGYTWAAYSTDTWERLAAIKTGGRRSPALGFTFDPSKVVNEMTSCASVISKYDYALLGGCINPDEGIPKFLSELKTAGIDKIITDKQAQLDAWLATKK
jgi:putative aldouronate transport system substrate-binding protein